MSAAKPSKRIIVACDGTWVNSDNGFVRDSWLPWKTGGHLAIPTNVTRFCRALLPQHEDGTPQVTYYQAGLGSQDNAYSFFIGGYLGEGISENIREAYAFICDNYNPGDQIFLIGFSRGAFTARSIGGLIASMGLLTKKGLGDFYPIFKDWENQCNPDYYGSKNYYPATYFPNRPNYSDPKQQGAYIEQLKALGLSRLDIPVEATAVWDTVGTLGVPQLTIWPLSWLQSRTRKEYSFIDTKIPSNLRHAYHALALDERRTAFSPTVWEMPEEGTPTELKVLKQCWFAGTHANVGGSYPDTGTADLTLAWIIQQLSPLLTFDPSYIALQGELNAAFLKNQKPFADRPWSCGQVYKSGSAFIDFLTGTSTRTPGTYCRTDPNTGAPTTVRLHKTHEFIHPSVRVRRALGGLGTADSPYYNSPWPLTDWKLVPPKGTFAANTSLKQYNKKGLWEKEYDDRWKWVKQDADGRVTWIAEDELQGVEWELVVKGSKADQGIEAR